MAGEIWFYHLERAGVEEALPPLLEKCLARGWRALVCSGLAARLDLLDAALWTYRDDAFLPHGREGPAAARQPVLLAETLEPVNGAKAAFLLDGASITAPERFERVCVMFDGRDEAALVHARLQWREVKAAGRDALYYRQTASGGWVRQGEKAT